VGKETSSTGGSYGKRRAKRSGSSRKRLSALLIRELPVQPGEASLDYDAALARSARLIQTWQAVHDRERVEAQDLVAEILAHSSERQVLILGNQARFHTWGVYSRLLEQSWAQSLQNPPAAEHLARLALLVADRLDASYYRTGPIEDLRARAWAYIGNSRRLRSDLSGAGLAFRTAAAHLRNGSGDPIERAILLDLEASLLRAERRFGRAMSLLKRAYVMFLAAGDRHRAGRALVSMEIIHHHTGSPDQGVPLLYQALDLIDPQQEPRLLLCVLHNLIDDLAEAGRAMEARRLFIKARSVYPRFPEAVTQIRRRWVAGKIACGLGQDAEGENLLLEARRGFLSEDTPYEVALVSLDLAALYAEQGRTAELRQLAVEMVPVFSSRQIHREALAALSYWKQAVEAETARERLLEVVAGVAGFLKRARYDSDLRFTAPA
jgi:tetratricopeptide (TPR) repeat protein